MEVKPLTVTDIILNIKSTLEKGFPDNTIVGEISNLSHSSAGHYYFNLSDEQSSISCALFKMDAFRNPAIRKIKNGDKVLIRGPVSLYARRGTFQIICKRVLPYGVGNLMAQYEMLKEKLRAEGLFDADKKRAIPKNIKKVAVLTALRGAALQDFLNVMKRKGLWYQIVIIPCVVQGDDCAPSIIRGLEKAKKIGVEAIVVTRGGGSMEDLWGFNDENLVRFVSKLEIPVISAVGHQVDYTLIDFVSDMRCETPSTAAELLIQSQLELYNRLEFSGRDLKSLFYAFKNKMSSRIQKVNPIKVLHILNQKLHQRQMMLERISLFRREDSLRVHERQIYLDELMRRLKQSVSEQTNTKAQKIKLLENSLQSLNPLKVLGRGYSYLESDSGKVVSSKKEFDKLSSGDHLWTHFHDGKGKTQKV